MGRCKSVGLTDSTDTDNNEQDHKINKSIIAAPFVALTDERHRDAEFPLLSSTEIFGDGISFFEQQHVVQ